MKKFFTTALVLLLSAMAVQAQLLWKVSGHGIKSPSYIFGTHHIAPAAVLDSVTAFSPALASVSEVLGEVDMSLMSDPGTMMKLQQKLMAPADSTLSRILTSAQLDSVVNVLNKYAGGMLTAAHIEPLTPSAIGAQLAILQSAAAFPGFNPAQQLDQMVQDVARKAGKTVKGLETLDFQMNLLYGAPIAEQVKELMEAIRTDGTTASNAIKLASLYRQGNLTEIDAMFNASDSGMTPEARERMVESRNEAWVEFLLGMIPTTSVLIVVGVGHLPGQKGLISLLKAAGYTVEPA
ncbi:MAG: TraB/GumN family protein [Muribaculaceae bacterium]|nr:TraB/GumN family protein [Muribaculaceae bacterium]